MVSALASRRTIMWQAVAPTLPGLVVAVVAGSALITLAARVAIPLPFSPVPITGQTFAVLLVGAALGSRLGALTVLSYLAEGLAGLPVFAGGTSAWSPGAAGAPVIVGPTAGYLAGFVLAAFVVGWLAERGLDRHVAGTLFAMALGNVAIYALGLLWLARFVGADRAVPLGLVPFLVGDALKIVLAAVALPAAWRVVGRGR